MKQIFMLLIILIPCLSFSQDFGNFKVDNAVINTDNVLKNNLWYQFKSGGGFFISFNKNPIGIKNCLSTLKVILQENDLNIDNPLVDSTYLSSLVKDIYDYEMLNISILKGDSEVVKSWHISYKQILALSLKSEGYTITILN